ncbi:hypothetical protein RJ640_018810 [Escallonia rubra]|uniref:Pectin acetylesterase n=1 Tax=Escallonia rubra TaxID=112253 RepID=A0AA88UV03_9ASTE|nr:hypothetical protein RJ640_018810 [Escallonia rubra]
MEQFVRMGFHQLTILTRKLEMDRTVGWFIWRIFVRYCDGSSFTGDVEEVDPVIASNRRRDFLPKEYWVQSWEEDEFTNEDCEHLKEETLMQDENEFHISEAKETEETKAEQEFKAFKASENDKLTNGEEPVEKIEESENTDGDNNAQYEEMEDESIDKDVRVHGGQNVNNSGMTFDVSLREENVVGSFPLYSISNFEEESNDYFLVAKNDVIVPQEYAAKRSAANLPPSCTSKMEPTLCFYAQYVVPQIQIPLFILNSAYDTYQAVKNLAANIAFPSLSLHDFTGSKFISRFARKPFQLEAKSIRKKALLTGCSAGGLASILHCDNFRDLMPATARVKCASDAGFFLHAHSLSLYPVAITFFSLCLLAECFYAQYVVPQIQTPLFILNPAYDTYQIQHILTPRPADDPGLSFQRCSLNYEKCSPRQTIALKDFRLEFIITLARLGTCSSRGLFINSCFAHCQSTDGKKWYGDFAEKLGNKRSAANLPPSCTSKMELTLCFYAQYVVPQIQTPLFILNSAYGTYQVCSS